MSTEMDRYLCGNFKSQLKCRKPPQFFGKQLCVQIRCEMNKKKATQTRRQSR